MASSAATDSANCDRIRRHYLAAARVGLCAVKGVLILAGANPAR